MIYARLVFKEGAADRRLDLVLDKQGCLISIAGVLRLHRSHERVEVSANQMSQAKI